MARRARHAVEVNNLGDKKHHQADDGDIIASQEAVGDERGHHGGLEEVILRKNLNAVDGAEQNAGKLDDGDDGALLLEEIDDEN